MAVVISKTTHLLSGKYSKAYYKSMQGNILIFGNTKTAEQYAHRDFKDVGIDGEVYETVNTLDFIKEIAEGLTSGSSVYFEFYNTAYTMYVHRKDAQYFLIKLWYQHNTIVDRCVTHRHLERVIERELVDYKLIPNRVVCSVCGSDKNLISLNESFTNTEALYCESCLIANAVKSGLLKTKTVYYNADGKKIGDSNKISTITKYLKNLYEKEGK